MSNQSLNLVGFTGGPVTQDQAAAAQQIAHRHQDLASRVVQKELTDRRVNLPLWQRSIAESNRSEARAREIYTEYRVNQVLRYIEAIESGKSREPAKAQSKNNSSEDLEALKSEHAILLGSQLENSQKIGTLEAALRDISTRLEDALKSQAQEAQKSANLGRIVGRVGRITGSVGRQLIAVKRTVSEQEQKFIAQDGQLEKQQRSIDALHGGLKSASAAFRKLREGQNPVIPVGRGAAIEGAGKKPITPEDSHSIIVELALFGTVLPIAVFLAAVILGAFLGESFMYAGITAVGFLSVRAIAKMTTVIRRNGLSNFKPQVMWGILASLGVHSVASLFLALYLGAKLLA